jgi:serine phosphatase RsbU (regulator of sigma subunit)
MDGQRLACMEIWGGSHAADAAVATPGLDLWVNSRPHEGAAGGGDVHYVSLCGGGVITRFVLADVAGHGASAAELARDLRDLMRRNINRKSQDRFVKQLNRQFGELARVGRFATAVVATYLTKGDSLTICNAGHPRPLWFRSATRDWIVIDAQAGDRSSTLADLPLGIDASAAYSQASIVLGRGDLVLFYTDALTEATSPDGNMLGQAGFVEMVRELIPSDPRGLVPALLERHDRYRGHRPADDDLTVLLLHHNAGSRRRLTILEQLNVYAKVFHLKRV